MSRALIAVGSAPGAPMNWGGGRAAGVAGAMVVMLGWLTGCSEPPGSSGEPQSSAGSAQYGEPAVSWSNRVERIRPFDPAQPDWADAGFAVVQTELSPATLIHGRAKGLSLFTGLPAYGLGAPSHLAFSTRQGPRSFPNGQTLDPSGMEENWILVWFAGASGWTNWDSPWAVFLQHRPTAMKLDVDGLHLEFRPAAGDVVVLPLYGYVKPALAPAAGTSRSRPGPPGIETWKWAEALRRDPLLRVRYWASATRAFPLYAEDVFHVDRARDRLTIRQTFRFHTIADDWGTRPLRVAPISPALALAAEDKTFPMRFSGAIRKYEYVTPYGPYSGIEGADGYEVSFAGLLQSIHEMERMDPPPPGATSAARAAWEAVRAAGQARFGRAGAYEPAGPGSAQFCQAVEGVLWYARGLPCFEPATRTNALAGLSRFLREELLVTSRLELRSTAAGRRFYGLPCASLGPGDPAGPAVAPEPNLPVILWTYAQYSGDWALIRERWELVRAAFNVPAGVRWATWGSAATASRDDHAAACLAMARLAYRVGDLDQYHYACSLFVRELVLLRARSRAADYCRWHQPWHRLEGIAPDIAGVEMGEAPRGWSIRSARAPAAPEALPWLCRWPDQEHADRPDGPAPDPSAPIAGALERLRRSAPLQRERLIPAGRPGASPWTIGPERDIGSANPFLVHAVKWEGTNTGEGLKAGWPRLTWPAWATSTGHEWTFGQVRPDPGDGPAPLRAVDLNWNTRAWVSERR